MAKEVTLSFVILTWNSSTYLERCLDSIRKVMGEEGISFQIIVVDNGSNDGTRDLLRLLEPGFAGCLEFILQPENGGTTRPRNLGVERARGDLLCILDSDTELLPGGWAEALALLRSNERMGLLTPRLLYPSGDVQHSVKRVPALWHKLIKIPRILLRLPIPNADYYPEFPFAEPMWVDTAISACWLLRREVWEEIGGLDEKIFYSPEDIDFCVRLRKSGLGILYFPQTQLIHHTQQITHRKPFSKTSRSHLLGLLYFYRKHGCWFGQPSCLAQMDADSRKGATR